MEAGHLSSMLPRPWFAPSLRVLVRESFETIILALLVFMVLHVSIQNYKVEGPSMQPTLNQNEYLIVNKLVYLQFDPAEVLDALPFYDGEPDADDRYIFHPPVRGEVVVFRSPRDPERDFVKRVIGLPGDTVEIVQGTVYVNGLQLVEPYLDRKDNTTMSPVEIEPNTVFVLGDNRGSSNDSRSWGPVPAENLIGRAWMRFWPLDHLGVL